MTLGQQPLPFAMKLMEISVGGKNSEIPGRAAADINRAIKIASVRCGRVKLSAGLFELESSIVLQSGVELEGFGFETVLRKCKEKSSELLEDADWYQTSICVKDPQHFPLGTSAILQAKDQRHLDIKNIARVQIMERKGNTLYLDRKIEKNFWLHRGAVIKKIFPVISGENLTHTGVYNLSIDGNARQNSMLNGNYGGGIFLQSCNYVALKGVKIYDFNGDGISYQICDHVVVENCFMERNRGLALHPGSGSRWTEIRRNTLRRNGNGLYLCWGVQHAAIEDNLIDNNKNYGISIGHRDNHNIIRRNIIRKNSGPGILFRKEFVPDQCPHDILLEENKIENNGSVNEAFGIKICHSAHNLEIINNALKEKRGCKKSYGIFLERKVKKVTMRNNSIEGFKLNIYRQK